MRRGLSGRGDGGLGGVEMGFFMWRGNWVAWLGGGVLYCCGRRLGEDVGFILSNENGVRQTGS